MNNILKILVLISTSFWSYFIYISGACMSKFFWINFGKPKNNDWIEAIPAITRLAIDYYWIPLSLVILSGLLSIFNQYIFKDQEKSRFIMLLTLWFHFCIIWAVLFFYCYEGFTGAMCLHHGPEFEIQQFLLFAFGFFPITFLMLLSVPIVLIKAKTSNHNQQPSGNPAPPSS